eukprot:TRINITY_DN5190_c0_g2_i1.p1 TRINITY_DN5190_c0_g2~~TRINITY_DN5190_c0_g2_i1.p1  ORF type:complete len:404 (+),score=74.07 TRINITY_DN5190_c0_g2_i1:81-1292(+)
MDDFDLEETMRKHNESLRHFRENVERDQREAGLLPAGVSLEEGGNDMDLGGFIPSTVSPPPPTHATPAPAYTQQMSSKAVPGIMDVPSGPIYDDAGPHHFDPFMTGTTPARKTSTAPKTTPVRGGGSSMTATKKQQQQQQDMLARTPVRNIPKTAHPLKVYDRVSQWARRREQKLDEERKKNEEKKVEGCPFTPQTRSSKVPYSWEQKSGSIYGGTGRAWGYDEFVERQREARRRSNEKRENGKYTGKNWTNEVTVCQEFQLGRRDRSIKALQKPLSPPSFVPTVSEHHHLAKEVTSLSEESPLALLQGGGLPQRGLFSERISTAIIDNTMLHPANQEDASYGGPSGRQGSSSPPMYQNTPMAGYPGAPSGMPENPEWAKRSAEKQNLEAHLGAHTSRPWRAE